MRCIIAGSRSYSGQSVSIVRRAVAASGFRSDITEVVSGGAKGIDYLGEIWARSEKLPWRRFTADWERWPKKAGLYRNILMGLYAAEIEHDIKGPMSKEDIARIASRKSGVGMLIAVHDGVSTGTLHMLSVAKMLGLRTFVGHPKEVPLQCR